MPFAGATTQAGASTVAMLCTFGISCMPILQMMAELLCICQAVLCHPVEPAELPTTFAWDEASCLFELQLLLFAMYSSCSA